MEMERRTLEGEYNRLMTQIGVAFRNDAGFRNGINYVKGLLGPAERKNGWQISEYLGEVTPDRMQNLIRRGRYSSDIIRDVTREYIVDNLGEGEGVLIVDDTGFIKKGDKSCGVQRQYTGTAGKIENCQIGVFLIYANMKGHSPIDRRLYLPEGWTEDSGRLKEAGVPESVGFQTKPEMSFEMIKEATAAGVKYEWVTGDCAYGDYREMRQWLELEDKSYVLCVSGKEYIWRSGEYVSVASILMGLPESGWRKVSCGIGSKGEREYEWQFIDMCGSAGWKRLMLIRRNKTNKGDMQAHICYGREDTTEERFIEIEGMRWQVETSFEECKGEVGMDHYEVRTYTGWYNHITFAMVAQALLTVLSAKSYDGRSMQEHDPKSCSLEAFKKKRKMRG